MQIRRYQAHDLNEVLALFQQTVRQVNIRDYSTAQIKAWLGTDSVTIHQHWQQRLLTTTTMVILDGQKLIAFGNILATGYLDCLYVHTEYQRQGLAKVVGDDIRSISISYPIYGCGFNYGRTIFCCSRVSCHSSSRSCSCRPSINELFHDQN